MLWRSGNVTLRVDIPLVVEKGGGNVSNLQLNPDGSIRSLNGFSEITGTAGDSQRQMRLGLRLGF